MASKVEKQIAGRKLVLESGDMARQADGAVLVTYGESVVLVTATAERTEKDLGFFPLTVDYRENQYAAGKFPGGIIKREGRPTTKEILTMRVIDRPIRPLFPDDYQQEVMVACCVLSADGENDPDVLAMIGASAALQISDIPWEGPTGSTRVGLVEDEFILNPTREARENSELEFVVSGTSDAVVMVEGFADIIPEEDVLTALNLAQDANTVVVEAVEELAQMCGKADRTYNPVQTNQAITDTVRSKYGEELADASNTSVKLARSEAIRKIKQSAVEELCAEDQEEAPTEDDINDAFETLEEEIIRKQIIEQGTRYDGRAPDDIREIDCRVAALPRTHGSALFTRGETQALVVTTLGTVEDEQRILDPLVEEDPKKFMLHYNFPGWCVGEVWRPRGPKRREIGHGQLAEHALSAVLPDPDDFPYTIRLVSDVLESNGSSSMASVCGGTLSLMDAGVAISDPVAGVAMGVVVEDDQSILLSDIAGVEDHCGDMDFKVAGTQKGITALQLDIKMKGVAPDILENVLTKARDARLEILRIMLETLRRPREEISKYAPKLHRLQIDPENIGSLIGPGGKTIRRLEEDFECNIEVEDDGTVTISSDAEGDVDGAVDYVKNLAGGGAEVGKIYEGQVVEIKDFGPIVELFPGTDGLCHISELDDSYVDEVTDICDVGDKIKVKVLEIDGNRIRLSRKAAMKEESD
ncbi:MAG: polyribonucleotide nucleotidyltransferase [Planctomycetes bacterium]|nr:polyribonucleotide nucleotidyltransferase [Planctomycetota bacterium]